MKAKIYKIFSVVVGIATIVSALFAVLSYFDKQLSKNKAAKSDTLQRLLQLNRGDDQVSFGTSTSFTIYPLFIFCKGFDQSRSLTKINATQIRNVYDISDLFPLHYSNFLC